MRKLIDIKTKDIEPLKILAVKANKDLKNYIQDVLSEHARVGDKTIKHLPKQLRIHDVSGSFLAVRIEEALAKYWYDTEYDFIDKTDDKKSEESIKRFRKWIDDNLEEFSK